MAMRNTNAAMADTGGSNLSPRAQKLATPRYNGPAAPSSQEQRSEQHPARGNASKPAMISTSRPIRSPLPGGGGSSSSRGSAAPAKAVAPKKPKGGNMYKNNKSKTSFGMAGASASEGRAQAHPNMAGRGR